ncbi:hypothetical protein WH50_19665 [Pokkaliibacter plantistimulans]|uniref:N-methyl-D-aspartate receptor NMDAR2C subunit n=1 Tax=Pokkaliibacter plantistimulans TaxID=1635171 RepID=A0ABX5LVV8_9GAMM|nr:hypothetical protein [Pokkaliibacter plantistimulans]PXF29633.1 hypothetical protein WH50_19665 [Pokkaliibacter plantistimulans]
MNKERFLALWQRTLVTAAKDAEQAFTTLEELYAAPGRHYHNGCHVQHCLLWLDRYRSHAINADAIELAIWFHDAIYEFQACDNEQRSAELFLQCSLGADQTLRRYIYDLILATTHRQPPTNPDQALIMDVDLSSFALPWHPFIKDSVRCRKEKAFLTDPEFFARQICFWESLLARPAFFYTPVFFHEHEQQARENVKRMLELMVERGYDCSLNKQCQSA